MPLGEAGDFDRSAATAMRGRTTSLIDLLDQPVGSNAASCRLRQTGAVKAIGGDAGLRFAENEITREGVGPDGQPAHQIGASFNDHQSP